MVETSGIADDVVKIGEETFHLRFSTKAIARLQKHWDLKSPEEAMERLADIESDPLTAMPVLLWAAVYRHHPEVTLERCVDLIDDVGLKGIPELAERIGRIATASFPQAEGGKKPRPTRTAKGRP